MASYLFKEHAYGELVLKNRVAMAPLTRGKSDPITRVPNDFVKEYYSQRASAGLIIAEATAISDQAFGWYAAPALYNAEQRDAWASVVGVVHENGGKIFLQLWHMGRQSHSSFHEVRRIVAPSAIGISGACQICKISSRFHVQFANSNPSSIVSFAGQVYNSENVKVDYEVPEALTVETSKQSWQITRTLLLWRRKLDSMVWKSTGPMATSLTSSCNQSPTFERTFTEVHSKIDTGFNR